MKLEKRLAQGFVITILVGAAIYSIPNEPASIKYVLGIFAGILTALNLIRLDMSESNAQQKELLRQSKDIAFDVRTLRSPVRLIREPKNPVAWEGFHSFLSAFNAPWILAPDDNSLYPAFKKFMSQPRFCLRVLMFGGDDAASRSDFQERNGRVSLLQEKLKADGLTLERKIEIAIVPDVKAPSTTFFFAARDE